MEGHEHGREQYAASAATATSHLDGLGWRRGKVLRCVEIERRRVCRGGEMSFAMSCFDGPKLEMVSWS